MTAQLPPIITQKPITKAMCFDLSNTLMKFTQTPGRSLLHRMQKIIKMDELHGTKIPAISQHMQSKDIEHDLTQEFYKVGNELQSHWPDFGQQNNVSMKLWWKNVIYNIFKNVDIIQDPFQKLRVKTDKLQLISPEDDETNGFAKTDGIMVNVYDLDFPHNHILFNFDEYFDQLFNDWSNSSSYQLYPDSRSFINFVYGHYYYSIVMG